MVRRIAGMLVIVLGLSVLPSAVRAQLMSENTINVVATENVRVQPTLLRLEVQIQAKGDTAEKAVKALQSRRKEALAKLKELKADEASIQLKNTVLVRNTIYSPYSTPTPATTMPFYGPPTVVPQSGPQLRFPTPAPTLGPTPAPAPTYGPSTAYRIPPDIAQTTVGPTTGSPATPSIVLPSTVTPAPCVLEPIPSTDFDDDSVTATTELRAEWRLTSSDPDAIALAGESLREKLIAAKLFGPPYVNQPPMYSFPTTVPPIFNAANFRLFYVGRVDAAQRKTALAAALARTRDRGSELAAAAGWSLGKISSVSRDVNGDSIPGSNSETPFMVYPPTNDTEAVSTTPDLPEIVVRLSVNYSIVHTKP